MSIWQIVEFSAGGVVALLILADIFSTLLVPGPTSSRPSILLNTRRISLMLWHGTGGRRRRTQTSHRFGPLMIVVTFVAWMLLLMLGFGAMLHAIGWMFVPNVTSFAQSLYIAGSSMVTLGVSEVDAKGLARWVLLAAGLAGFCAVTATITFSIQIQAALRQRETDILTLAGIAGSPPSGIAILESFVDLDTADQLGPFFIRWRDWSAGVLHSHSSYPVLAYFASTDPETGWLTALEAVLDAATAVAAFTDHPARGQALMLHRTGSVVATRLRRMARLDIGDCTVSDVDVAILERRLRAIGLDANADASAARRFVAMRDDYAGSIGSIADHLGARRAPLLND